MLLLVASETGHVYTFATPKLQPLITKPEGKNLIQACLNAPDGTDYAQQHAGYDDDGSEDRPMPQANAQASMAAISSNYAAAMAGLAAGYPYPQQAGPSGAAAAAMAQAYMNQAAHYNPAYAAHMAASQYWPQGTSPQPHERSGTQSNQPEASPSESQGQH